MKSVCFDLVSGLLCVFPLFFLPHVLTCPPGVTPDLTHLVHTFTYPADRKRLGNTSFSCCDGWEKPLPLLPLFKSPRSWLREVEGHAELSFKESRCLQGDCRASDRAGQTFWLVVVVDGGSVLVTRLTRGKRSTLYHGMCWKTHAGANWKWAKAKLQQNMSLVAKQSKTSTVNCHGWYCVVLSRRGSCAAQY